MWEVLSQVSALSIFLGIAAFGFLFLLLSLVFGEISEFFGDFDHDMDHGLSHGGPGFFSTRVMSVFVTAFGGIGSIAITRGYPILTSSVIGLVGGVTLATPVYFFARFLYSQQASSLVQVADLIGRTAQITVAIPPDGLGQIRCLLGESVVEKTARSHDGSAIPFNSLVRIEELIGETVIVSPLSKGSPAETTAVQPSRE